MRAYPLLILEPPKANPAKLQRAPLTRHTSLWKYIRRFTVVKERKRRAASQEPPQDEYSGRFVYGTPVPRRLHPGLPQQTLGFLAGESLVNLVDRQRRLAAQSANEATYVLGLRGIHATGAQWQANDYCIGLSLPGRVEHSADIGSQAGAADNPGGQGGAEVVYPGCQADAAFANVKGEEPHRPNGPGFPLSRE